MSGDAKSWFAFADENLAVAELALENGYFNACLQNAQQAVEKYSSIYIPSKYPTQSVLPDFEPDQEISQHCVDLAKKVREALEKFSTMRTGSGAGGDCGEFD
ncbi:MAG: HEPN domain-containing protein [Spartobacteria bacterium]|nr:HEPN domain-containing protein [Spartobacteria bacterium]